MKSLIALLILSTSLLLSQPVVAAKSAGTWQFYGEGVLGLSGARDAIETAIQDVHSQLGRYTKGADGSSSDPSFKIQSQSWQGEKSRERVTRSLYSFDDSTGKPVQFEIVEKENSETLIFIEYGGAGGTLGVLNKLKAALEKQGIKQRES